MESGNSSLATQFVIAFCRTTPVVAQFNRVQEYISFDLRTDIHEGFGCVASAEGATAVVHPE